MMSLHIVFELIQKPNNAFEKISQNPQYFRLAAIIFSSSILISIFHQISTLIYSSHGFDALNIAHQIVTFGGIILSHTIMIAIIFHGGKRAKGSSNIKQIFLVLLFCLIPTMIGIALVSTGNLLVSYSESDDGLIPSYEYDFIVSPLVLMQVIILSFFIWSMALYIKAIRITDNFSTLQAVILLIFALIGTQVVSVLYSFGTNIPLQLLF